MAMTWQEFTNDEKARVDRHKAICEELTALYARKNHDYGDSFHRTFEEYGLIMPCIRLEDKLGRLKTLVRGAEQRVADESIWDTVMDIAGYAIMTLMELAPDGEEAQRCSNMTSST